MPRGSHLPAGDSLHQEVSFQSKLSNKSEWHPSGSGGEGCHAVRSSNSRLWNTFEGASPGCHAVGRREAFKPKVRLFFAVCDVFVGKQALAMGQCVFNLDGNEEHFCCFISIHIWDNCKIWRMMHNRRKRAWLQKTREKALRAQETLGHSKANTSSLLVRHHKKMCLLS